jgi:hypothetical protein
LPFSTTDHRLIPDSSQINFKRSELDRSPETEQ